MNPLVEGQRVRLSSGADSVDLRCVHVTQRNWSRVVIAEDLAASHITWFVKQSVDRELKPQVDLWRYEKEGQQVGAAVLAGVVDVPRLGFSDAEQLLHAFEFKACVPPDTLLRTQPDRFAERSGELIAISAQVLDALEAGAARLPDLERRERDYGGEREAICFKGLDVRNLAWACDSAGALLTPSQFVMFDFGRGYRTVREEPAAKLLVSIAMLNWGRPMLRFCRGPDLALLDRAAEVLGDRTSAAAMRAEIDLQERGRFGHLKAGNLASRLLKRVGLAGIGARYLDAMRRWCDRRW
jgi:hypothetical protein